MRTIEKTQIFGIWEGRGTNEWAKLAEIKWLPVT
jgi:hypothetical protein